MYANDELRALAAACTSDRPAVRAKAVAVALDILQQRGPDEQALTDALVRLMIRQPAISGYVWSTLRPHYLSLDKPDRDRYLLRAGIVMAREGMALNTARVSGFDEARGLVYIWLTTDDRHEEEAANRRLSAYIDAFEFAEIREHTRDRLNEEADKMTEYL